MGIFGLDKPGNNDIVYCGCLLPVSSLKNIIFRCVTVVMPVTSLTNLTLVVVQRLSSNI